MSDINIQKIDHSYNEWLSSLDFYLQDLSILKNRLTEIGGKNNSGEIAKQLEHYENQFAIQKNNIEHLQHDIRNSIYEMSEDVRTKAGHVDGVFRNQFSELGDKYKAEEQVVNDLRHAFNRFSAEWM